MLTLADQGYFFVGGRYTKTSDGQIMTGQMYVQYQIPQNRTQPYPVVMWHGGGQTGTNFMGTPDGRKGWSDYFVERGYAVYIVDQPGRARSGYFTEVYGKTRRPNTGAMSDRFTAPERANQYPQAKLHTQWPGTGLPGDPAFDQFFASQVEDIADVSVIERLNRAAGVALLDKIGPAILLTHSQSGAFGWPVADARPNLVKALVAAEPSGPPVHNVENIAAPDWFKDSAATKPSGLGDVPLSYDPPLAGDAKLEFVRQDKPDKGNLVRCWMQKEPARRLPNLQRIPVVIIVAEASYHAAYDHCTAAYLTQAGVRNTLIYLADAGVRGNGHMMMIEKNNAAVAGVIAQWLDRQKLGTRQVDR